MKTKLIGICGGSGSGKTTLAKVMGEALGPQNCALLYQDSYYIDQSHRFDEDGGAVNFDHPDSLELALMAKHLNEIKTGKNIEVPKYDFATHTRQEEFELLSPAPYVIVDGILIYNHPEVREAIDFKIFVDTKESLRFKRRLERDVNERGRSAEGVKAQYQKQVLPMHEQFVAPLKEHADFVVSGEIEIANYLDNLLKQIEKL